MNPSGDSTKKPEERKENGVVREKGQNGTVNKDKQGFDVSTVMKPSNPEEERKFGWDKFKPESKPHTSGTDSDTDSTMPNASDEKLRLRQGAEELELPDEATGILDDLRQTTKGATPTVKRDGKKRLGVYDAPILCEKLSFAIAKSKVRNETPYCENLEPRQGKKPRPEIFGFEKNGVYTNKGFIGVAVLITDSIEISIQFGKAKPISHVWNSGKILILMPETTFGLKDGDGEDVDVDGEDIDGDGGNIDELETRGHLNPRSAVFFYTMLPVG
ncbi:hypothetical protein ACJZ2D_014949 [Fusarium nematophilum]